MRLRRALVCAKLAPDRRNLGVRGSVSVMSMETHVFFRGKLPSKAALSRAMKELGFPYTIKPATGSLEQQNGFMPMLLHREETGVEFDVFGHDAVEEFADQGIDPSYERVANFRWGGDFQEAVAGMCSAAALAKLVNGIVFDESENRLLSVEDAIRVARKNLQALVKPDAPKRLGTRPADIKRYLKPLLTKRNDLVLIGRTLIIRPVRHLLRGVLLDRTGDKYQFQVWRYINPLLAGGQTVGYGDYVHPTVWRVWQPFFEPLLLDTLADIFDYVGGMTTLDDFAGALEGQDRFCGMRVTALVLGGQRERAAKTVDEIENLHPDDRYWGHWVKTQRAFLDRDIASICAEFHAKEAETARELKLGDLWEPAPFPVEVPEAERMECDEPRFATAPWVSRPPGLLGDPPEGPGEVRFAEYRLWRNGCLVLLVPLTREAAEEKHRTYQDYVLATRLEEENLFVLHHHTGWSPHNPEQPTNPDYVPTREFRLEAYGSVGRMYARFTEDFDARDVLKLQTISVYDRSDGREIWYAFNDFIDREKSIRDYRSGGDKREPRPMTASDLSRLQLGAPRFGDIKGLVHHIREYLRNEGFGTFV
jgi:hypothetical protein